MSISNIIGANGTIIPGVLPNPYPHPPVATGLGAVLAVSGVGNSLPMTNVGSIGCADIVAPFGTIQSFSADLIQSAGGLGNLGILPVNNLTLKGCQTKGSLLVGDGTSSKELPVGVNGLVLKANSAALNGYGVEWAVDGTSGITGVSAGPNITIDSITNPLVPAISLANPFNAGADIGTQQVMGAVGDISMDLMGGHLNYVNTTSGYNSSYIPTSIGFNDQLGDVFTLLDNFSLNLTDTPNGAVASLGADSGLNIKPLPFTASGVELTYTKFELIKEDPIALTIETSTANKDGFTTITEQTPAGSGDKGVAGIASNTTQGEVSVLYENQTIGASYQGTGTIISNAGASTMTLTSSNIAAASSQQLRVECPAIGDTLIEHTYLGATQRNLDITTQGNFSVLAAGSGGISLNAGGSGGGLCFPTTITNSNIGGQANPLLTLTNSNATGAVAVEIYRNKPTAGAIGDVLHLQSVYGKDGTNAKQEYTRITHTLRDGGSGTEDGSIEFSCFRAGAINTFLQINGVENEINVLKNIDMSGYDLRTNQGDMVISSAGSSGNGKITIAPKALGNLILQNIPTASAGLPSGAIWSNAGVLNIIP